MGKTSNRIICHWTEADDFSGIEVGLKVGDNSLINTYFYINTFDEVINIKPMFKLSQNLH